MRRPYSSEFAALSVMNRQDRCCIASSPLAYQEIGRALAKTPLLIRAKPARVVTENVPLASGHRLPGLSEFISAMSNYFIREPTRSAEILLSLSEMDEFKPHTSTRATKIFCALRQFVIESGT